jgi:hypothetical protein
MSDKRWFFLEEERALVRPDWLPTPEEWPAFAEYQQEHVRLLDLQAEAARECGDLRRAFEEEEAKRSEALTAAFLSGGEAAAADTTPPKEQEAALREATLRLEAVNDALVTFLKATVAAINERADEFYAEIQQELVAAKDKQAEAQRLLAEADALERGTKRRHFWLDRTTFRSSIKDHYPFGQMEIPPVPEQIDWALALGGGQVMEVEHV